MIFGGGAKGLLKICYHDFGQKLFAHLVGGGGYVPWLEQVSWLEDMCVLAGGRMRPG